METKKKYFWYIIVLVGGAGVWFPVLTTLLSNQKFAWKDVPPNMVTYFISVAVSGCADKGIKLLENIHIGNIDLNIKKWQSDFIDVLGIVSFSFLLVVLATLSSLFSHICFAYLAAGVGVYIALKTWWNANVKEETVHPTDALGGNNFD